MNMLDKIRDFIREKTGLFVSDGVEYGKSGEGFIRINLATSLSNVKDGLLRLSNGIKIWEEIN